MPGRTLYVTERYNAGIAKVTVDASGTVTTDNNFVTGLPRYGPDSVIFDHAGRLIVSNTDQSSISIVDPSTGHVIVEYDNNLPPAVADMALDPANESIVAIGYNQSGPLAIVRMSLATGATTSLNPDGVVTTGGVAFTPSGRLFVSSHNGSVAELDAATGHVLRTVTGLAGEPDGLTIDPSTGILYASDCGGLCSFATTTASGTRGLSLIKVDTAINGDGIAADGAGHIYVVNPPQLVQFDLATDAVNLVSDQINTPDDVAPVIGPGSPVVAQASSQALDVKLPVLLPEIGPLAPVRSTSGTKDASVLTDGVPGVATVGVGHDTATASGGSASGSSTLADVQLLGGLVSVRALTATASATWSGGVGTPSGGVNLVDLTVGTVRLPVALPANTVVPLLTGTLVINEQVKKTSASMTSVTVNALHYRSTDGKTDIVVGSAAASAGIA